MLNNALSEVMSVVEEILYWDGVEPLARGHISCEKSTENGDS